MHKVSVCITTYNRAKWLQETIDSVLRQEGVELEVLILDNGSKDGGATDEVLGQYTADPRFSLFAVAHNMDEHPRLPTLATGDFITVLPDDDLLLGTDSLARRAKALWSNPEAGFVFSSVRAHDADGNDKGMLAMGHQSPFDLYSQAAPFDRLFMDCFVPMPSGMFRKKYAHLQAAPHVLDMGCSDDWMFWTTIACEADQCFLAEPTVSLRQHAGQDTYERGLKKGGFLYAHIKLWEHWTKFGHQPTHADVEAMQKTFDFLAHPHRCDTDPSYGVVYNFTAADAVKRWLVLRDKWAANDLNPNVYLNIIVKDQASSNEAHVIVRCLESCKEVISGVIALCTTKSGENTGRCCNIIEEWCRENKKVCVAGCKNWDGDFSHARNSALALADRTINHSPAYLLLLDADEINRAKPEDIFNATASLNATAWVIPTVLKDGSVGTRINLVRHIEGGWRYEDAIHETIKLWGHSPTAGLIGYREEPTRGPHIFTPGDGARSLSGTKLEDDIASLRRNQRNWRNKFFLASLLTMKREVYSDAEAERLLHEVYSEIEAPSPETDGFKYMCCLQIGRVLLRRGLWMAAVDDFLHAYSICPTRVEALGELAQLYAQRGEWAMCRLYALGCAHAPEPMHMEFLEPHWARWRGIQLLAGSIAALGQLPMALQYYKLLASREGVPEEIHNGVVQIIKDLEAMR